MSLQRYQHLTLTHQKNPKPYRCPTLRNVLKIGGLPHGISEDLPYGISKDGDIPRGEGYSARISEQEDFL